MRGSDIALSDDLQEACRKMGPEAADWLEELPQTAAFCAGRWDLELGYVIDGTPGPILVRSRRKGRPLTLNLFPPGDQFERQCAVLQAARGRGYPLLYEADADRRALLVESLASTLEIVELQQGEVDRVDEIVTGTLRQAWTVPISVAHEVDESTHPAARLRDAILAHPATPDIPDCSRAVERALAYAEHRLADNDPARHVVVHGAIRAGTVRKVHALRPGAENGHVLIEPAGLRCAREYDLGLLLRDANRWLLSGDDPVVAGRNRCAHLAEATGTDAEAIWQWSVIQRVERGLALSHSGTPLAGRLHLQAATAMVNRRRG